MDKKQSVETNTTNINFLMNGLSKPYSFLL